ncbi:lipid IV(A) palmitoyltransferase PagP [Legionella dresdenensis]|uniref:Lipid IV(A) palmitoyltransferase PagP n=1 Tax=Legionella dresdenensis TaxID=450200 RepID=A0ABV8CDG5_9GAMM
MKKIPGLIFFISCFFILQDAISMPAQQPCQGLGKWIEKACSRLHAIWTEGDVDLYLTGYAWHNRYTYTSERVKTYNEQAWGTGLGRSMYDQDGDWHGLYAVAFLDSHKNFEPTAGYAFLKTKHWQNKLNAGLGFSVLVTARPDIMKGIPFPGAVPMASVGYDRFTLYAAYVPGRQDNGNVLFVFGKIRFDKL